MLDLEHSSVFIVVFLAVVDVGVSDSVAKYYIAFLLSYLRAKSAN